MEDNDDIEMPDDDTFSNEQNIVEKGRTMFEQPKDEVLFFFPADDREIKVGFYRTLEIMNKSRERTDILYAVTKSDAINKLEEETAKSDTNPNLKKQKHNIIKYISYFDYQIHFPVKVKNPEDALSVEYDDNIAYIRITFDYT